MNDVEKLLYQSRLLWRGSEVKKYQQKIQSLATGFDDLDKILPEGGWPEGALVDLVLSQYQGFGELQLLLPAMRNLIKQERWILWVAPPYIPYAPALESAELDLDYMVIIENSISNADKVWVMEQSLKTAGCGMVLCWLDMMSISASRRLQLAAELTGSTGFVFQNNVMSGSIAALRLLLKPSEKGLLLEIVKARGASRYRSVEIPLYGGMI